MVTAFSKDSVYKNVDYAPFDRTAYTAGARQGQKFSIYYPIGSPSDYAGVTGVNRDHPGAWAYMVYCVNTTYLTSTPDYADGSATTISETTGATGGVAGAPLQTGGVLWQCLMNGIAVVSATVTAVSTTNAGGSVPNGFGMFHAPGGTSGFYEDHDFSNAPKDSVLLLQHLQWFHDRYNLHRDSWGVIGSSGGSDTLAWCSLAPSRAYELGTWGPYQMNTVPNVAVHHNLVAMNWGYYAPTLSALRQPVNETSSTLFASNLASSPPRYLREIGAAHFISSMGDNCVPPIWYHSDTAAVSQLFGMPYPQATTDAGAHSVWHGLALKNYVGRGRCYLATGTTGKSSTSPVVNMATAFDRVDLSGLTAIDDDAIAGNAVTSDNGTAIRHILGNINKPRWDLTVPAFGIGRRGQVNSVGRFCVPPAFGGRAGVEVVNSGGEGFSPLLVGTDPYTYLRALPCGQGDNSRMVVYSSNPIYLKAYGGALAVSQYRTRELPSLSVKT